MKKTFTLLIVSLIFSITGTAQNKAGSQTDSVLINNIIETVRQQYVPDKRTSIYEIKILKGDNNPTLKGYISNKETYKELIKILRDKQIQYKDSIEVLPTKSLGDKIYGVINLSVADIRTKGDFSAEMATQALLGTPIRILQEDDWYRIQTPDEYIAWTQKANFHPMTKQEFNNWIRSPKLIFTDYFGFSYQYPDKEKQTIGDLVTGNILRYEGESGDFYKVSYPDGRSTYILKHQARPYKEWKASLVQTGDSYVKKAFKLMGIPYVWGGTSVKGMDCSGFTKDVLFQHGVILTRDASQQVNTGTAVDISNGYDNLQIGDLMFFGKKASGDKKERIRHVAFYIGNKEFIHASGCIRIGSLDPEKPNYDERNTTEFIRASRITNAIDTKGIWDIDNNPMYQEID